MPVVEHKIAGFGDYLPKEAEAAPAPSFGETAGAAFRMENDVLNAFELFSRPAFTPNPDFDITAKVKASPYWENHRDNFVGVRSEEEYNFVVGQIEKENEDRATLARAGWSGTALAMAAGTLSPTMFLPFVGEARGTVAVLRGLALGGAGAALQELPLQANQATRTAAESTFGIAAGTILGGVIGGAVASLRPGEREALEGLLVQPQTTSRFAVGAQAVEEVWAGKFDSAAVRGAVSTLGTNPITRSPVAYNINSSSPYASWAMAQLDDTGLPLEGNARFIPTTPGGTVHNRVTTYNNLYIKGIEAIDGNWNDYYFGSGNVPKYFAGARSALGSAMGRAPMSKEKFKEEIWWASIRNDQHEIPEAAQAAKALRRDVIDPMGKQLEELGLLKKEIKLLGDPSYMTRMFLNEAITGGVRNEAGEDFVALLAKEFKVKLDQDFAAKLEKFYVKKTETEDFLSGVSKSDEEIAELKAKFQEDLEQVEERANADQYNALEDTIAELRSRAYALKSTNPQEIAERRQMLRDARDMEKTAGEGFAKLKGERKAIERRLRNFTKARIVVEAKLDAKLTKIARSEELSLATLTRAVKAGRKVLDKLDKYTDEELDAALSDLRTQFEKTGQIYDRGEERIAKLLDTEVESEKLLFAGEVQAAREAKLTDLAERIADAEDLGRDALRSLIADSLDEMVARANTINGKRAVRAERLKAQAAELTPEAQTKRIDDVRLAQTERESNLYSSLREMGADNVDLAAKSADFSRFAREAAIETKDKILGTYMRLPTVDIMAGKRGAVLARVLDVSSEKLAPWLEKDVDKLVRSYVRTLAPDIEINRKFKRTLGDSMDMELIFRELHGEKEARLAALKEVEVDGGKGVMRPLNKQELGAREKKLNEEYALYAKNMEVVLGRLRHQWGLPRDPDGIGYRMGKVVSILNVLRYMGMVTVSSIPDVARPIMRHGLTRTFRDGFIPLITNFKQLKLSAKEAKLAGAAVDVMLSMRAQSLFDVTDDLGRGSRFERGLQFLTSKQGIIAGFNYWTDALKQFSGVITNARLMDDIVLLAEGKLPQKEIAFLTSNGIGIELADRIYAQVRKGGAEKNGGVWMPNTELWDDPIAQRAFRAATAREVNNIIVTPGPSAPAIVDSHWSAKMIFQFKSFALASTYKTLLAGVQQKDMAVFNGAMISLALGAFSYYVRSMAQGGEQRERMENADPSLWADKALQNSGLMGGLGIAQDILSRLPATQPYVTFSGGRTTTRGGDNLLEQVAGPSLDFMKTLTDVLTQVDDPTKTTISQARELAPWQNLIYLKQIFDQVENAIPVPETRQ